jgi:thiamine-phosphate pyrophosphorylase
MSTLEEARGKLARAAARLNARHCAGRAGGLPPLVLMTDDAREVDWAGAVAALPRGAAVIVRHRDPKAREVLARCVRKIAAARRVRLLVADDLALAMRVRADGVHVPQRHATRIAAVKAAHPTWLVTTSAHGAASVAAARRLGADAVIVGPVFATASHPGREALGVMRFASFARRAPHVYALGGVDAVSVQRLAAHPLSGVALIGGWVEG